MTRESLLLSTSGVDAPVANLAPLLAAKGQAPALPRPHVARPNKISLLVALLRAHRLVVLTAGAFAGKTTLLAEFAHAAPLGPVLWYTVDEVDATPRLLLEGLTHAVSGSVPAGDETHLLAHAVGALGTAAQTTVLVIDGVHRSPACLPLVERLLRYAPRARLLLSGRPHRTPGSPLWHWLEDQDQVAYLSGNELRLDDDEQERFRAATGRDGGVWTVDFRRGGQARLIEDVRAGVLPTLEPESRAIVELLCVLPLATAPLLGAALSLPAPDVARRLAELYEETILLERHDAARYRLSETARQAVLADLGPAHLGALCERAATALEPCDPAQAALLFVRAGAAARAMAAARQLTWWDWRERQALSIAIAADLPPAVLARCSTLALVVAHLRIVEQGPRAAHALLRAIQPTAPLERIERLRLLAHCCAARGRSWGLHGCVAHLEALIEMPDPGLTALVRSYGLTALGIARDWQGQDPDAAAALRRALALLPLAGGESAQTGYVRLLALRALARVEERLGHLDEAERLYAAAHAHLEHESQPHVQLEVTNNWAVLLQQRGEHVRSAEVLRQALASPWVAERGLRALLHASLADALDALGDRSGAARAVHDALADLHEKDVYGLRGYLYATLTLLLAEAGETAAARAALAAGTLPSQPAAQLAQALLRDPLDAGTRSALEAILPRVDSDHPLRARVRAHLARVAAAQGDRPRARKWADMVVRDPSYPLTAREASILGTRTHRVRRPPALVPPSATAPAQAPVGVRFFGTPTLTIAGQALGSAWWAQSKERELLWYALAHGAPGFTREAACADLFPEMDAERGGRALRNALYEVRKLLRASSGAVAILTATDGRLRLMPEDLSACWEADTQTLDRWLARLRDGDLDAAGDLPRLLAGRYLAGLHGDWTRPFRHYWESEALHALDLAATQYERAGCPAEALTCLRRALEFSPDDTALPRRVMLLYHALDDPGGLRATYLLHRRVMREELDADPDPQLSALYEKLTR